MKILAIDSSSLVASVAIVTDGILTAEYTVNFKQTHSQTLLPMIDEICRMTKQNLEELDAIAISAGPGSFTGLRIGSATAKGLGLALDKPLISVPTLDAMAYQFYCTDKLICPIMDARRQQVYTGVYRFANGVFENIQEEQAISIAELVQMLKDMQSDVIFTGDGIPVYKEYLKGSLKEAAYFAPPMMNRQRAAAVVSLAQVYFEKGKMQTAAEHEPHYLRVSQAEREREQKLQNKKTDGRD